ncbi:hypothetical protein GCM10023186_07300 [Hymenobacter koreensis]|uniref:Carboxypeptidase-like regulatory domain-containing protein n=1 Tax=Hymenobacter koreensis TaxID=1084523 RepID=A0ABP8IV71_9BACT
MLVALSATAQTGVVSGVARDSVTRAPLPFASVFLANTTRGTVTDEAGRFTLPGVPVGSYDVVVSYLGYRLTRQSIFVTAEPLAVTLLAAPISNQLAGVTIRPRPSRPEDYRRFVSLFLGNSAFSKQCRIRNPKAARVDYDAQANELTAEALGYLQVDNMALGYRIRFHGLHFQMNFGQQVLTYYAWPVFEELPTKNAAQRAKWAANRQAAYAGSLTHFLRSVRNGRVADEGFVANRLRRVANPRWVLADSILNVERKAHAGQVWQPHDTLMRMLQEPPRFAYLYTLPLPADSLRRPGNSSKQVMLRFKHLTQVTYTREKPDPAYYIPTAVGKPPIFPKQQVSVLHLLRSETEITPTGQLLNPLTVFTEGYWGFEKVGELLPVDYEPAPAPGSIGGAGKKQ